MRDNAAFKKLMISFLFPITATFCLRVFKYNNNKKVSVKQNELELRFGFWVFSYLLAEVADKYSLEMVLKEENGIYIFFSSFTLRTSNSRDDNFLLFEMPSIPLFLYSLRFIALSNYYEHNLTFAIFTSGNFFHPTRA